MATYEEALAALKNADAAGDVEAAKQLSGIVERLKPAAAPAIGKAESLGRGGLQGATLGFGDELSGLARGAAELVKPSDPNQGRLEAMRQGYNDTRDSARQQNAAAQKANPVTYGAGELAGTMIPAAASFGATAVPSGIAKTAAYGAEFGGLNAAGHSSTDDPAGLIKDTAKGAALGALAGGATRAVAPLIGPAGAAMQKPAAYVDEMLPKLWGKALDSGPTELGRKAMTLVGGHVAGIPAIPAALAYAGSKYGGRGIEAAGNALSNTVAPDVAGASVGMYAGGKAPDDSKGQNQVFMRALEQLKNDGRVPASTPEAKLHVLNQTDPEFRQRMKEEEPTEEGR